MATHAIHIEHPSTGHPVTYRDLAIECGMHENTIRKRYADGKRGAALTMPVSEDRRRQGIAASSKTLTRQQLIRQRAEFLASPAGRLTTHLFRDYGRAG
ncbi:hypothetical protein [Salinicola rhizosphaerae]|uniref:Uncharacterized protein n=1 Tax=Salinicola rhizosphaerae TaxID=1443141 RepID=A0ABQ3ECS1_9GAMM|nr:hypothetical protein [Salinicola rhizosphaerae]GHB30809.1 hypothetical protein GCM10009038_32030 [Salinicola rhizosphaerae]